MGGYKEGIWKLYLTESQAPTAACKGTTQHIEDVSFVYRPTLVVRFVNFDLDAPRYVRILLGEM